MGGAGKAHSARKAGRKAGKKAAKAAKRREIGGAASVHAKGSSSGGGAADAVAGLKLGAQPHHALEGRQGGRHECCHDHCMLR
jgi:hypothetical protein